MSRTHEEIQAAIASVTPVLREAAEEAEHASEAPQRVIDALHGPILCHCSSSTLAIISCGEHRITALTESARWFNAGASAG